LVKPVSAGTSIVLSRGGAHACILVKNLIQKQEEGIVGVLKEKAGKQLKTFPMDSSF
jgi:hypothetical protein